MDVWLRESRARSLIASAIEVFNRETDGIISGKIVLRKARGRKRSFIYVEDVHPIQTAERKPSQVSHGNIAAFRRLMNSLTSARIEFMGGYHSHPEPYKGVMLSRSDVDFIKDELDYIRHNRHFKTQAFWLEILMCIRRIRYQRRQKTGWEYEKRGKKVIFNLTITPYTRYEITMASFWIDYTLKVPLVKETSIFLDLK